MSKPNHRNSGSQWEASNPFHQGVQMGPEMHEICSLRSTENIKTYVVSPWDPDDGTAERPHRPVDAVPTEISSILIAFYQAVDLAGPIYEKSVRVLQYSGSTCNYISDKSGLEQFTYYTRRGLSISDHGRWIKGVSARIWLFSIPL